MCSPSRTAGKAGCPARSAVDLAGTSIGGRRRAGEGFAGRRRGAGCPRRPRAVTLGARGRARTAPVAQWLERPPCKWEVMGSIPIWGSLDGLLRPSPRLLGPRQPEAAFLGRLDRSPTGPAVAVNPCTWGALEGVAGWLQALGVQEFTRHVSAPVRGRVRRLTQASWRERSSVSGRGSRESLHAGCARGPCGLVASTGRAGIHASAPRGLRPRTGPGPAGGRSRGGPSWSGARRRGRGGRRAPRTGSPAWAGTGRCSTSPRWAPRRAW